MDVCFQIRQNVSASTTSDSAALHCPSAVIHVQPKELLADTLISSW